MGLSNSKDGGWGGGGSRNSFCKENWRSNAVYTIKNLFLRRKGDTEGVLFLTHFVVTQVCLLL